MGLQSGHRVTIVGAATITVTATNRSASSHLGLIVVRNGKASRIAPQEQGIWRLDEIGTDAEIVIGTEDREDPVSTAGEFIVTWGDERIGIAPIDRDHRAVILFSVYERQGKRILKVSGEGYVYGLEAYGRRNGIDVQGVIAPPRRIERERQDQPRRDSFRQFHGAQGSGVSVSPGIVITNHHVIEGGRRYVVVHDGVSAEARLIGSDEFHDLALLRHDPIPGLEPVPFRDAAETYLGEDLIAAGYPLAQLLGDDVKMSNGNISGLKGPESDVSRLQFTAPIASGSSGGAIVDLSGRLIGVVAATLSHEVMRSQGASSENINFAVKASLVREMMISCGLEAPPGTVAMTLGRQDLSRRIRSHVVAITSR